MGIHTLLLNMIGCQGIKSAVSNRSNKMFVRHCLLISFVIAMIYLITPSSSLPLEGALGSNENRFRFRAIPSSDMDTPNFLRKRRRTLPFQLMPQPEPPIYVNSNRLRESDDVEMQPKISASELLSILGNLAYEYPQGTKRQMRFGLF